MQAPEDFLGQFDGHGRNRDRRRSNGGFGADALGYGKGPRQQLIELGAYRSYRTGGGVGFFNLSQNLGLTDDHGVEAGGYAKNMADRLVFFKFVKMSFKRG